jgi:hypothetical protein
MEANRYNISAGDCNDAKEYLDAYLELKEKDDDSGKSEFWKHREGLLVAAIVSYSRPFTKSRRVAFAVRRASVNVGKVFANDESRIKMHEIILDLRHKAVAHSDWEYRNTELVEATETQVSRHNSVVDYHAGIDIEVFRSMAEAMRNHFRHQMYDRDVANAKKAKNA